MKAAPVYFHSIFSRLNEWLQDHPYSKIFIIVDENTHAYCLPKVLSELESQVDIEIIELESGEINKTIETVANVWLAMSELGADRKSLVLNIGGGVITDMGGFIASTFKRGIDFINIPTTLLSQVDASVGGKNGIDLEGMKNQIGTFTQPKMVLVYPEFLKTLKERELLSGLAEMLKHGLIAKAEHWNTIISLGDINAESIAAYIEDSVEIKKRVVEADPYESGLRKILNFGHTVGHAVESELLTTDNSLLHGEAIIVGMLVESIMSKEKGYINESELNEIFEGFTSIYHVRPIPEPMFPRLLEWMKHDKKNDKDNIKFSLLRNIGEAVYNVVLSEEQIIHSLNLYNEKLQKNDD